MLIKEVIKHYCFTGELSRYFISQDRFKKCRKKVKKLLKTGAPVTYIDNKHAKVKLVLCIYQDAIGYTMEEKYAGDTKFHSYNEIELKQLFEIY